MTAGRIRLIVVANLVVTGALAVDASGGGSSTGDGWDATLRYSAAQAPAFPRVSNLRLRVTRRGLVVYNRAVVLPRDCAPDGCRLAAVSPGRPFQLVDLGSSKGPTALIWLWTGGAQCCTVLRAVSIPDGATAAKNFGDHGARLVLLRSSRVFASADSRFARLFTSFASSGVPIRIWRFRSGHFFDVTRMFPEAITADAARWWKVIQRVRRTRGEARGSFAAWAADMCALGERTAVRRELAAGVAAGVFSPPRGEPGGPTGARYAAALRRELKAWGYCR